MMKPKIESRLIDFKNNFKKRKGSAMKRVSSCLILSFLILFIVSQLSYAEPKGPVSKMETGFQDECPSPMMPPPCDMGHMKGMLGLQYPPGLPFQSINLDDKQKETLKEIENNFTKELIRKRADEQIAEVELRELLEKDTVDLNAVETKLKQIATIKTETQLIFIKSMEKMKVKLTPEQRERLKKMRPMAPPMRPPLMGEMMRDETKMLSPSAKERSE
ncbi:MAG: periplasmic heavy metal sensor [Smithella sp.]|jgi:Spy/CpxP family protein refolding chaperone